MMKLLDDFLYNATVLDNIRDRSGIKTEEAIVLTTEHLDGAFGILCLGLMLSCVVFFCEIGISSGFFANLLARFKGKNEKTLSLKRKPRKKIKTVS